MPDIKDTVGDGGTNAVHDVAMVQMMLRAVKDAKNAPYFAADYTGTYSDAVKNAIIAFQTDKNLLPPAPVPGAPAAPPPANVEKKGLVALNSQTLAKLNAALPAKYAAATIIADTKTLYLAMDAAAATASAKTIGAKAELDATFRGNVAKLVNDVFQQQKIALTIPGSGWRRTFAEQAALSPAVTGAGPGESNHNYGQAVDIGFNHLNWIDGNGDIVKDNYWLSAGTMSATKQAAFWEARNKIAAGLNIFPTHFGGDLIHLQAYDDANVGYANSLAGLLNSVTVKTMKWQAAPAHPNKYKNDFGLGGAKFAVGTGREIWASNAPVQKADLVTALNAKAVKDKNFKLFTFFGVPPDPKQVSPAPPWKDADIKDAYLVKIKADLKADFAAADANWTKWKPLP